LDDELTVADFEQWIYRDNELETSHPTLYQDLILLDLRNKDARHEIKQKIKPYINLDQFNVWRTKRLLIKIIEDNIDIVLATRKLKVIYYDTGENYIPVTLGIGFDSVVDDLPTPDECHNWNPNSLKERLKTADSYKERIKKDAVEFLETLKG